MDVGQDLKKAYKYFKKSADEGYSEGNFYHLLSNLIMLGQCCLGILLNFSQPFSCNVDRIKSDSVESEFCSLINRQNEAFRYLKLASDQGILDFFSILRNLLFIFQEMPKLNTILD